MTTETKSFHQQLMDTAFTFWREHGETKSFMWFVESIPPIQQAAVMIGTMNYQVENGGWAQWHYNDYFRCAKMLKEVLTTMDDRPAITAARTIILQAIRLIHLIPEEPRLDDDITDRVYAKLEPLDAKYYAVNTAFMAAVNEWLIAQAKEQS